jgi:hypothetical protein
MMPVNWKVEDFNRCRGRELVEYCGRCGRLIEVRFMVGTLDGELFCKGCSEKIVRRVKKYGLKGWGR